MATIPDLHERLIAYLRRYNVEVAGDFEVERGDVYRLANWLEQNPPVAAVDEFEAGEGNDA